MPLSYAIQSLISKHDAAFNMQSGSTNRELTKVVEYYFANIANNALITTLDNLRGGPLETCYVVTLLCSFAPIALFDEIEEGPYKQLLEARRSVGGRLDGYMFIDGFCVRFSKDHWVDRSKAPDEADHALAARLKDHAATVDAYMATQEQVTDLWGKSQEIHKQSEEMQDEYRRLEEQYHPAQDALKELAKNLGEPFTEPESVPEPDVQTAQQAFDTALEDFTQYVKDSSREEGPALAKEAQLLLLLAQLCRSKWHAE